MCHEWVGVLYTPRTLLRAFEPSGRACKRLCAMPSLHASSGKGHPSSAVRRASHLHADATSSCATFKCASTQTPASLRCMGCHQKLSLRPHRTLFFEANV